MNKDQTNTLMELTLLNTKLTNIVQRTVFKLVESLLKTDAPEIREIAQATVADMKEFETEYRKFSETMKNVSTTEAAGSDLPGFYL